MNMDTTGIINALNQLAPMYHASYGFKNPKLNVQTNNLEHTEVPFDTVLIAFNGKIEDHWYQIPPNEWYNCVEDEGEFNHCRLPTLNTASYITVIEPYMRVSLHRNLKSTPITLEDVLFATRALSADGYRSYTKYNVEYEQSGELLVLSPFIDNFSH